MGFKARAPPYMYYLKDEQETIHPILKLKRNARVLNGIKVELRIF